MLSFFRRLRRSLLGKGKFSNYLVYAFGEILLVMVGILLALQINTWNDQRRQRAEEMRILKNLESDLRADITQLERNIASAQKRQAQSDTIMMILEAPESYSPMKFIQLNSEVIGFESHFEVNSGTFDESLAAGTVKFIRDDSLRQGIFTYYRDAKRNYADDNTIDQVYRDIFPYFFESIMANRETVQGFLGATIDLPPIDIGALSKDKKYISILFQKIASESFQIKSWQRFVDAANALQEQIGPSQK